MAKKKRATRAQKSDPQRVHDARKRAGGDPPAEPGCLPQSLPQEGEARDQKSLAAKAAEVAYDLTS